MPYDSPMLTAKDPRSINSDGGSSFKGTDSDSAANSGKHSEMVANNQSMLY